MSAGVERPIILPLSNPTERIEAMPADVVAWSGGKALVATGIPVEPFDYRGTRFTIGQGNNALLYPGLGLGVIVSGASRVTDGMYCFFPNASLPLRIGLNYLALSGLFFNG